MTAIVEWLNAALMLIENVDWLLRSIVWDSKHRPLGVIITTIELRDVNDHLRFICLLSSICSF